MRWVFAIAGVAALAWGAWLLWDLAARHDAIQVAFWFAGGPVLHDAVVAPVVGLAGLVLAKVLPPPAKAPVVVGLVLSGVLVLLTVPLVWRPYGVAVNPGLHDRNYVLGLTIALGVVWLGVAASAWLRRKTNAARGRARG
jgi:hypothetical protein